jgi:hypothetical protein
VHPLGFYSRQPPPSFILDLFSVLLRRPSFSNPESQLAFDSVSTFLRMPGTECVALGAQAKDPLLPPAFASQFCSFSTTSPLTAVAVSFSSSLYSFSMLTALPSSSFLRTVHTMTYSHSSAMRDNKS